MRKQRGWATGDQGGRGRAAGPGDKVMRRKRAWGKSAKAVPRTGDGKQGYAAKGGKEEAATNKGQAPMSCRATDGWVSDQAAPQTRGGQRGLTADVDWATRSCCGWGACNEAMPRTDTGDTSRAADRGERRGRTAEEGQRRGHATKEPTQRWTSLWRSREPLALARSQGRAGGSRLPFARSHPHGWHRETSGVAGPVLTLPNEATGGPSGHRCGPETARQGQTLGEAAGDGSWCAGGQLWPPTTDIMTVVGEWHGVERPSKMW